ncbi:MAG TPA: hypothetical protein VJM50_21080 [Pyrinomonadaceae bacterium]|nr:hypothetical protein [Pyrinomonadaceae bacterium]
MKVLILSGKYAGLVGTLTCDIKFNEYIQVKAVDGWHTFHASSVKYQVQS